MGLGRLVVAQLWRRGSRTIAMLLGLVIASAGFSVLTAQTKAETLAVRGTVNANARSAYDVLVRPTGSVSQAEASDGLVQAQFLSGIQGGISMRQLHQIRRIPDVEVAAPVAVIGYVVPKVQVPVLENHRFALTGDRTLFRIRSTWHLDNGATVVRSAPRYQYVTAHELVAPRILFGRYFEVGPQGRKAITRMYDMQKTESSVRRRRSTWWRGAAIWIPTRPRWRTSRPRRSCPIPRCRRRFCCRRSTRSRRRSCLA